MLRALASAERLASRRAQAEPDTVERWILRARLTVRRLLVVALFMILIVYSDDTIASGYVVLLTAAILFGTFWRRVRQARRILAADGMPSGAGRAVVWSFTHGNAVMRLAYAMALLWLVFIAVNMMGANIIPPPDFYFPNDHLVLGGWVAIWLFSLGALGRARLLPRKTSTMAEDVPWFLLFFLVAAASSAYRFLKMQISSAHLLQSPAAAYSLGYGVLTLVLLIYAFKHAYRANIHRRRLLYAIRAADGETKHGRSIPFFKY